ncbi:MAG: hypothetical protein GY714_19120 [Desulfobacterales bacterium]|nr:hypothetical protein [Desulfobacterales bacterium]
MKEDNIFLKTTYVLKHCFCFSIFVFMSIFYLIFMPLIFVLSLGSKKRYLKICHIINLYAFRFVLIYTRFFRFIDIRYEDLGGLKGGQLFACNHISMFDIVTILASVPDCYTLVNVKFVRNPLLLPIIKSCGYIPVNKNNPASVISAYGKVKQLLRAGKKVVIFPEGTRSTNGLLQKLQRGVFRISVETNIPIVPVFLTTNRPFINKRMFRYDLSCVHYRMFFLPPLKIPKASKKESEKKLMCEFQEKMINTSKSELSLAWHKQAYSSENDIKICSKDKNGIKATTIITKNHVHLDGHFTEFPILPGISQIEIINQLISEHLGYEIVVTKLSRVKFLDKILPDTSIDITINLKQKGFAHWEITNGESVCSKGKFYYSESD